MKAKPRYEPGQVVAWCTDNGKPLAYYRVKEFFFDDEGKLRYKFNSMNGDSLSSSLSPIESLLRPLTDRECGPRRRK